MDIKLGETTADKFVWSSKQLYVNEWAWVSFDMDVVVTFRGDMHGLMVWQTNQDFANIVFTRFKILQ